MRSTIEDLRDGAAGSRNALLDAPGDTSISVRGGIQLTLVRGQGRSVLLPTRGSCLCVNVSGRATVHSEHGRAGSQHLCLHALHILRQPIEHGARRIVFDTVTSLAVVISFPDSWCAECPRGPACQVGRFLMHGRADDGMSLDEHIDIDERGLSYVRGLLDLSFHDDADILAAEQSILALLAWAYRRHSSAPPDGPEARGLPQRTVTKLRHAAEILGQRLDDPPTIAELSALVGMNECDLKRCFKCRYGDSIASFSRNKRLAAAQDLLLHSGLSVAEIALEVGFTNPSQFARAFRRRFDVNPAQYRHSAARRGQ